MFIISYLNTAMVQLVQILYRGCQRPINTNVRDFADDKCILLNENVWNSIKISLKFVPKGLINNMTAMVQIMAWRQPGDKPLSELMMVSLLTHICITRPHWVNPTWSTANIKAADGQVMQGTRASAAMVLTWFSWNILVSAPKSLRH